jgi:hypothetical protein
VESNESERGAGLRENKREGESGSESNDGEWPSR